VPQYGSLLRFRGASDGLPNAADAATIGCQQIRIAGNAANEFLDLTWYDFGCSISFRNARNSGSACIEFHGASGSSYGAVFNLQTDNSTYNRAQVRNNADTDAVDLQYHATNGPLISTEQALSGAAFLDFGVGLSRYARINSTSLFLDSSLAFGWSSGTVGSGTFDTKLVRISAGVLALKNADNAQEFRAYGASTGTKYAAIGHDGSDAYINASSGTIGLKINGTVYWFLQTNGNLLTGNEAVTIGQSGANRPGSLYLAGPAITAGSGTGFTLNNSGEVRRLTYKCTVTFAGFSAAALTADKTIATLPAKGRLVAVYTDTTQVYSGGAVATATLQLGKTVGGTEYILAHDVKTATIRKGLADADLGASISRANAVQGGDLPSFTATTAISARITTTGANTNALTQGSTTFYLEVEVLP
jgi:hypothetical protein